MSALTTFRDHCRRMAKAKPTDPVKAAWTGGRAEVIMPVGDMPDSERALWQRLAGEIDAYLAGELETTSRVPDDVPLEGL